MRLTVEAKDALKSLILLGYPRNKARKAVATAIEMLPNEAAQHDFEKVFRAAMYALR